MKFENLLNFHVLSRLVCFSVILLASSLLPLTALLAQQVKLGKSDTRRLLCLVLFLHLPSLCFILHSFLAFLPIYREKKGTFFFMDVWEYVLFAVCSSLGLNLRRSWEDHLALSFSPILFTWWRNSEKLSQNSTFSSFWKQIRLCSHISFEGNRQDHAAPHPMRMVNKTVPPHPWMLYLLSPVK